MSIILYPCLRRLSSADKPNSDQRRRRSINLPVWPTLILNMDKNSKGSSKRKTVRFPSSVLMQQAISEGNVREMAELVDQYGSDLVAEPEPSGLPPVMRAIFECQPNSLKFLVEAGADLAARDQEGWNALHVAAAMDDLEAARYILQQQNCQPLTQVRNADGVRPIDLAESAEMAELLLEADLQLCCGFGPGGSVAAAVATAAAEEEKGVVGGPELDDARVEELTLLGLLKAHCEQQQQQQQQQQHGGRSAAPNNAAINSLLHLSAEKNYPRLAKYILERNLVDTEVRDRSGWTPLHVAAHSNSVDVTVLLVQYGASVQKLTADSYEKASDLTESELIQKVLARVVRST